MWLEVFLVFAVVMVLPCTNTTHLVQRKEFKKNEGNSYHGNCSMPPICDCLYKSGVLTANCESRNISSQNIPVFAANVSVIKLNSNNISMMPENKHFGNRLLYLHLQQNNMSAIDLNAFRDLKNLLFLDLSGNQLTTNSAILHPGVFRDLASLQTLHLYNNSLWNQLPADYPEKAITDLVSLQTLSIDGQTNKSFGFGFSNLKHLVNLIFSGLPNICNIITLEKTTFQQLIHLEKINASFCSIHTIERGTFSPLVKLTHLILSNNIQLGFKVLYNVTNDLQFTSIKILEITNIHSTFGLGTMLRLMDVYYLKNTSLEVLKLDGNRLEMCDRGLLTNFPLTLNTLSLTENKLALGWYVFEVINLIGLKVFNGSNQYTSHDPRQLNYFSTFDDSQSNELRTPIHNHSHSLESSYSRNLKSFADVIFNCTIIDCIYLPPNVEIIDYSSSTLSFPINRYKFKSNSVKQIYLQSNTLFEWNGPIEGLEKLELLDLSNNFCSKVSDIFFDNFQNLSMLYLQKNFIGYSLRVDTNGNIFKNLSKLQKLDISDNKIDILFERIFKGLLNLEWINLSNNSLTECNFGLSHMGQLKFLDLSFNHLTSLPKHLMNYLDKRVYDGMTVSIKGNDLVCSCDTMNFLEWFQNKEYIFISAEKYMCRYNGHSKKIVNINLSELRKSCTSYTGTIIGAVVGILLMMFIIAAGLVYRFRWKLRYLYYMAKNRYIGYTPVQNDADDSYLYDAFIAYSDLQRKFVTNDMIQHLEKDAGLSLCIHHRDFLPGNEIGANITDAINKSRRTVAVVSRDFLQSYWCMFELNMARMEGIYSRDGRNTMFLILYENDIPSHLPLEFYDLIDANSYIEYPNDPQCNLMFWKKVSESLTMSG